MRTGLSGVHGGYEGAGKDDRRGILGEFQNLRTLIEDYAREPCKFFQQHDDSATQEVALLDVFSSSESFQVGVKSEKRP